MLPPEHHAPLLTHTLLRLLSSSRVLSTTLDRMHARRRSCRNAHLNFKCSNTVAVLCHSQHEESLLDQKHYIKEGIIIEYETIRAQYDRAAALATTHASTLLQPRRLGVLLCEKRQPSSEATSTASFDECRKSGPVAAATTDPLSRSPLPFDTVLSNVVAAIEEGRAEARLPLSIPRLASSPLPGTRREARGVVPSYFHDRFAGHLRAWTLYLLAIKAPFERAAAVLAIEGVNQQSSGASAAVSDLVHAYRPWLCICASPRRIDCRRLWLFPSRRRRGRSS